MVFPSLNLKPMDRLHHLMRVQQSVDTQGIVDRRINLFKYTDLKCINRPRDDGCSGAFLLDRVCPKHAIGTDEQRSQIKQTGRSQIGMHECARLPRGEVGPPRSTTCSASAFDHGQLQTTEYPCLFHHALKGRRKSCGTAVPQTTLSGFAIWIFGRLLLFLLLHLCLGACTVSSSQTPAAATICSGW